MAISYTRLPSNEYIKVALGPTGGATGVQEIGEPTAAELNNTAGSGMIPASWSISWNDFSFGMEASETLSEPSLADAASFEEFGANNYGGSMSFYYPAAYDDNSNLHSLIYDLTDLPGALIDAAVRIDGALPVTTAFADGDFVSVYRVSGESEANPFTPGESKRRTVGFTQKGDFAYNTIVGPHTLTAIAPASYAVGDKGRIRVSVQGRDYTNAVEFATSDGNVINIYPGGFFEVVGTGTATVTITDSKAGTATTVTVTPA